MKMIEGWFLIKYPVLGSGIPKTGKPIPFFRPQIAAKSLFRAL
jgi:hypothetical protein